jgi:hypothetical protein
MEAADELLASSSEKRLGLTCEPFTREAALDHRVLLPSDGPDLITNALPVSRWHQLQWQQWTIIGASRNR